MLPEKWSWKQERCATGWAASLPYYMVPSRFVQIEHLPLTISGKVDKKELAQRGLGQEMGTASEYVAPRNEVEEGLVQIWQDLLGREKIGIRDNFFSLGGHSLNTIRMLTRIKKSLILNILLTTSSVTLPLKILLMKSKRSIG